VEKDHERNRSERSEENMANTVKVAVKEKEVTLGNQEKTIPMLRKKSEHDFGH
tara:strand:+ start:4285 stop:4443 length:159 start_codon:yes stop_codon:yes gene_type:complete